MTGKLITGRISAKLATAAFFATTAGCGMMGADAGTYDGETDSDVALDASTDMAPLDEEPEPSVGPEDWELDCVICSTPAECDDGLTCSGPAECAYSQFNLASCCRPQPVECPSADPCVTGRCTEEAGGCVYSPRDDDGDGHAPEECGHDDCDDTLYAVHPGAEEICDALDNDCDGVADEGAWKASPTTLVLSDTSEVPSSPSIASSAAAWGVSWISDTGATRQLNAGIVSPADPTPATSTAPLFLDAGEPDEAIVVSTSDGFAIIAAVSSASATTIVARAMGTDGAISGVEHVLVAMSAPALDLAAATMPGGNRMGLAFRSDPDGDYEIYFIGVDWPSPVAAAESDLSRITTSPGFSGRPAIVGTSTGFALAWEDAQDGDTEIYFQRLDPAGEEAGPTRRITAAPGDSQHVTMAASSDGYGLAWMDSRSGGYDLLFTCLDPTGVRICPETGVGDGPDVSWYPVLAASGIEGQLVLAFAGRSAGLFWMYLTAVSTGATTTPTGIDAGTASSDAGETILAPGLAEAGGRLGLLWIEDTAPTGTVLGLLQLTCEEDPE